MISPQDFLSLIHSIFKKSDFLIFKGTYPHSQTISEMENHAKRLKRSIHLPESSFYVIVSMIRNVGCLMRLRLTSKSFRDAVDKVSTKLIESVGLNLKVWSQKCMGHRLDKFQKSV